MVGIKSSTTKWNHEKKNIHDLLQYGRGPLCNLFMNLSLWHLSHCAQQENNCQHETCWDATHLQVQYPWMASSRFYTPLNKVYYVNLSSGMIRNVLSAGKSDECENISLHDGRIMNINHFHFPSQPSGTLPSLRRIRHNIIIKWFFIQNR